MNEYQKFKLDYIKAQGFSQLQILDVGCGDFYLDKELSKRNYVVGIDSNSQCKFKHPNFRFINFDLNRAERLQLQEKFDVIILFDVLEHLIEPNLLLSTLQKFSKESTIFLISVPNQMNLYNRMLWFFGSTTDITDSAHLNGELLSEHFHRFSKRLCEKFLISLSFQIIEKEYFISKKIRHKNLKLLQPVLSGINLLQFHKIFPALFSFSIVFKCKKGAIRNV